MLDLYIARQPIFDRKLKLFGYELLYRAGNEQRANVQDANQATAQVITLGLIEIGLEKLVGSHHAFINLSRDYVLGNPDLPFPPENVVLEILEDIPVDDEIISALKELSKRGYTIALDDLHPKAEALQLLPLAGLVKVDLLLTPPEQLPGFVKMLQQFPVKLLAEKVEDGSQVNDLLEMGFDYLQGFFFSKPIIMKQRQMSTNQLAILQLMSRVYDDDIAPEELENVICNDVSLSYHLLRYINSAFFNLPNKVESIRQAVIYLGRNELRTWTTVVSMAGNSDKPDELMNLALVRGKTCELLAKTLGMKNLDAFFTTGLLSVLDAMMDQPMPAIIEKLPISEDIQGALLKNEGILGEALSCSQAYELGNWKNIKFKDVPITDINNYYVEAISWANEALESVK
jgi:c-di-GMP phosphodiesterase